MVSGLFILNLPQRRQHHPFDNLPMARRNPDCRAKPDGGEESLDALLSLTGKRDTFVTKKRARKPVVFECQMRAATLKPYGAR